MKTKKTEQYIVMQDNGLTDSYYINRYFKDTEGTTRRETIYDGLSLDEAASLCTVLDQFKNFER